MFEYFLAGFVSTATHDAVYTAGYVRALNDCKNEILSFLSALKCDNYGAVMFGQSFGSLADWETLDGLYNRLDWIDLADDETLTKRNMLKDLAISLEII